MSANVKQAKREITEAAYSAIRGYWRSMRGARLLHGVVMNGEHCVEVSVVREDGTMSVLEVTVKEVRK